VKPNVNVLILAAGESKRFSSYPVPKQLVMLHGRPVVSYCLDIYQNIDIINSIVLVVQDKFATLFNTIVNDGKFSKVKKIVSGGAYRQDSIFGGLSAMDNCDFVVIQNAVSIFTSPQLINDCIEKAKAHKAVSAFSSEEYSSFTFGKDKIEGLLDRSKLGHVRDPQVFDYKLLLDLHQRARKELKEPFTNDIFLAKTFGQDVYLVESHPYNFKITTDIDIKLAKTILELKDFQVPPYGERNRRNL